MAWSGNNNYFTISDFSPYPSLFYFINYSKTVHGMLFHPVQWDDLMLYKWHYSNVDVNKNLQLQSSRILNKNRFYSNKTNINIA